MRNSRTTVGLLLALSLVTVSGCTKLQARIVLKEGNLQYQNENYKGALAQFQKGLGLDPGFKEAWRSVGLSAMALYKPGDTSPENKAYAQTAIDAFEKYLAAFPRDEKVREYLLTTLLNAERYDDALAKLQSMIRDKPGDEVAVKAYATVLMKANRLQDALVYIRKMAKPDKELFHAISVTCWDKAYRDPNLDPVARGNVVAMGLEAAKDALKVDSNYFEANVYHGLLLREKAKLEPDPDQQALIIAEAVEYQNKAKALRQAQLDKEKADREKAEAAAKAAAAKAPAAAK